jgi:hypothetical protein
MGEPSSPEIHRPRETDCGIIESAEGHADIAVLELTVIGLPGVVEDGMPGKNVLRKLGTTRGSARRSAQRRHRAQAAMRLVPGHRAQGPSRLAVALGSPLARHFQATP